MRLRAFSLVEVVVALGIISFVLVALLGLSSSALNRVGESRRDSLGLNMIQDVVSEVRASAWPNVANRTVFFDADGIRTEKPESAFYECSIEAVEVSVPNVSSSPNSLKRVVISISWPKDAAKKQKITTSFSVARYE